MAASLAAAASAWHGGQDSLVSAVLDAADARHSIITYKRAAPKKRGLVTCVSTDIGWDSQNGFWSSFDSDSLNCLRNCRSTSFEATPFEDGVGVVVASLAQPPLVMHATPFGGEVAKESCSEAQTVAGELIHSRCKFSCIIHW